MAVTVCSPFIDVLIIRRGAERWNQTTGIRAELCTATVIRHAVCARARLCVRVVPLVCAFAPINTLSITPLSMSPHPPTDRPRRSLLAIKWREQSLLPDIWAGLTTGAYLGESGEQKKERDEDREISLLSIIWPENVNSSHCQGKKVRINQSDALWPSSTSNCILTQCNVSRTCGLDASRHP